eukprot:5568002-Lingulodinium_polyedra.AAC.1
MKFSDGWAFVVQPENMEQQSFVKEWLKKYMQWTVFKDEDQGIYMKNNTSGQVSWLKKLQAQYIMKYPLMVKAGAPCRVAAARLAAPLHGSSYFWDLRVVQDCSA